MNTEEAAQVEAVEHVESASDTSPLDDQLDAWPVLGAKASWAAKAVGHGSGASQQPPSLDVDKHEWPVLSAATSTTSAIATAGMGASPNVHTSEGHPPIETNGFLQVGSHDFPTSIGIALPGSLVSPSCCWPSMRLSWYCQSTQGIICVCGIYGI